MTAKTSNQAHRLRLIKLIHVARRELGMEEESYRLMLAGMPELAGKTSSAKCTIKQLDAILEQLKKRGFKVRKSPKTRAMAPDARSRKIRSLWLELHEEGIVRDPSEQALSSFVLKNTGVSALQWLSSNEASRVIEHLKQWRKRTIRKELRGGVHD